MTQTSLKTATIAAILTASASSLGAAGLDRSFQSISPIFADDGFALSYGVVMPDVTGSDNGGPGSYDVGDTYQVPTLSYTRSINDQFNFSLIYDTPYGASTTYGGNPATDNLAGTGADLSSDSLGIVGRYKINDRFSVFGGIKAEQVEATVTLNGTSYAQAISVSAVANAASVDAGTLGAALQGDPTAVAALGGAAVVGALGAQVTTQVTSFLTNGGYRFELDRSTQPVYLIGGAYEIPDIALRLAVTYHFETDHDASTTENIFGSTVNSTINYKTPQSLNIDFQTGIAQGTLLTASYRWTEFEAVDVVPTALGSDLVNLDNGQRFTIGIARRFSDAFAGSVTLSYEPEGDDNLVSPLGPTDGLIGLSVGGQYSRDNMVISGGINYSKLGDAQAEVGNTGVATFDGNHSVAIGLRAEFKF